MKLRERIILAVLPLFLLLGVVGNGLSWWLQWRELQRGWTHSASAMAVALAAHVEATNGPPLAVDPLQQLERWGVIRQIQCWDASGRWRQSWPAEAVPGERPAPTPALARRAADGAREGMAGPLTPGEDGEIALVAGAPWRDAAGGGAGWLEVTVRAVDATEDFARMRRVFWRQVAFAGIVGALVAWALAVLLSRETRRLTAAAASMATGTYRPPERLRVAELRDLGETFGVLDTITRESREKHDRLGAKAATYQSVEDLGRVAEAAWMPGRRVRVGGREVGVGRLGGEIGRWWHGVAGDRDHGWLWMGRVSGDRSLATVRLAAAVTRECEEYLMGTAPDPAALCRQLGVWYAVETVRVFGWRRGEPTTTVWIGGQDGVRAAEQPWTGAEVWHELVGPSAGMLDVLAPSLLKEAPEQTLEDLQRMFADASGVVAWVKRDNDG